MSNRNDAGFRSVEENGSSSGLPGEQGLEENEQPVLSDQKDLAEQFYRPRLALQFGITGHRPPRLNADLFEAIKSQCIDLFEATRQALVAMQSPCTDIFAPGLPELELVSSLAEGADVLAAEAALACGMKLSACLPFPPDIYAEDFGDDEWKRTQDLIDEADSVVSLSGSESRDHAAYEAAGRLVLAQSDILIAVWDGGAAHGRGGTTQIIAEAVALNQPVIHIDATGRSPPELLWSGLHTALPYRPSIDSVERADAMAALPGLVTALCEPPRSEKSEALNMFMAPASGGSKRAWAWPLLMGLTGAKPWRKSTFQSPDVGLCASWMRPHTEPFAENGSFGHRLNTDVISRFAHADERANHFALRFRSSFITNFALAGLAVLLALSGLLAPQFKLVFIFAELVVILLIIANTRSANRLELHRCWLDHRHLAERLRLLTISGPLGQLSLRDVEDGTTQLDWVAWYVRATARELGLTRASFDAVYLARVRDTMLAFTREQIAYHEGNARAMKTANHRLHKIGDALFIGTIVACLAYLISVILPGQIFPSLGLDAAKLVTFFTALFPALAATLYGIRMQGDFAAAGERSSAIARQLGQLKLAIEADPLSFERLVERSRRLGEIMLAETQQWRLHFETRPLNLPG